MHCCRHHNISIIVCVMGWSDHSLTGFPGLSLMIQGIFKAIQWQLSTYCSLDHLMLMCWQNREGTMLSKGNKRLSGFGWVCHLSKAASFWEQRQLFCSHVQGRVVHGTLLTREKGSLVWSYYRNRGKGVLPVQVVWSPGSFLSWLLGKKELGNC